MVSLSLQIRFYNSFLHCFYFFLFYWIYWGDNTGKQNYTGFRYTILQHIISTVYCVFNTLGQSCREWREGWGDGGIEQKRKKREKNPSLFLNKCLQVWQNSVWNSLSLYHTVDSLLVGRRFIVCICDCE